MSFNVAIFQPPYLADHLNSVFCISPYFGSFHRRGTRGGRNSERMHSSGKRGSVEECVCFPLGSFSVCTHGWARGMFWYFPTQRFKHIIISPSLPVWEHWQSVTDLDIDQTPDHDLKLDLCSSMAPTRIIQSRLPVISHRAHPIIFKSLSWLHPHC